MRAINHSLTGALIGLSVIDPLIAIPAAFASHFLLDAIPHYGAHPKKPDTVTSRSFIYLLIVDAILCIGLVALILIKQPDHWLLAIACAFIAAMPDLFSINHFHKAIKKRKWSPNLYSKFAGYIQWFERPIGLVVEMCWLIALILMVSIYLK